MPVLPTPPPSRTALTIGHIPTSFDLPRGQTITCTGGCLWITSDALAGFGRDSDVVLESGQSFVTLQAASYCVGAPLGHGELLLSCATGADTELLPPLAATRPWQSRQSQMLCN